MPDNKTKKDVDTEEITITVRKDFDPGLRSALISQLQSGTDATRHFVVGNLADLQRAGAAVIAGEGGFEEGVALHPDVDEAEAKAGAERTLREEAEAKAGPVLVEPPVSDEPLTPKDPDSQSPQAVDVKKSK